MPINVYTGLMGSGKSYEVVRGPILDAIAAGRRVVTNVDGINNDGIRAYLVDKRKLSLDSLGSVIHVTNEQCASSDFFPSFGNVKKSFGFEVPEWVPLDSLQFYVHRKETVSGKPFTATSFSVLLLGLEAVRDAGFDIGSCLVEAGEKGWKSVEVGYFSKRPRGEVFALCPVVSAVDTIVRPGDLVCIDEAWRIWGTDCKILDSHKSFFLEHRHFTDPLTNVSCDLVMMIQDIGTLHRFVRVVVSFSFRTHKKVSLGMPNRYSVEMFEGHKFVKTSLIGSWSHRYDKAIFPLYSSFKGGVQGKILNVDKRQNALFTPFNIFLIVFLPVMLGSAVWILVKFFNPSGSKSVSKPVGSVVSSSDGGVPSSASPVVPASPAASKSVEGWRIAGMFTLRGESFVLLTDSTGRFRYETPSNFVGRGVFMVGTVDGQRVSTWSGASSSSSIGQGLLK